MWQKKRGTSAVRHGLLAICLALVSACEGQRPCHVDYEITATDQGVIVADSVQNRDGSDTLVSIERIRFSDKAISMESKASDQRIGDPRTP